MQESPTCSTSGSLSWSVGTKQACQPENVLSASMQQSLPQPKAISRDVTEALDVEQQLLEDRGRAYHLQRENDELRNKLSRLQQQHGQLRKEYERCQQVIRHHECCLSEHNSIILQLQNGLERMQSLTTAVTRKDYSCNTLMDPVLSLPAPRKDTTNKHTPTTVPEPAISNRDHMDYQDQMHTGHSQLPAAGASLGRLPQLQQEQGSPVLVGDTVSAGARLQPQAPTVGSKRSRLCSATGSAGGAANLKRAASGASGSSSSRQQLLAGEEPLDEGVGEIEPANCYPNKRPYSPNESNVQQLAAAADEDMEHVDEDIEEKSQDDLEAAECLQALATSASQVHNTGQHSPMMRMPSNPVSVDNLSSIMAVAAKAVNSNQSPWTANNSAGAASNSAAINPMLVATLQAMFQGAAGGQGFDACGGLLAAARGAPVSFMQPPQQVKQLPHQHHVVTAGPVGMRRPDAFTAGWGAAPKMSPASGGNPGHVRARNKQSWFKTEIEEKIPPSVQQACAREWAAQECMPVRCAELTGTFYVNSGGEYMIELANGEVVTPNKFEELAGKKTARNWQQSIRVVGYHMNGEESSALLKLGHFTRIVGLSQDK